MSFDNLNIIAPILMALKEEGYTQPTPIQQQAIPIVLRRKDLLGCAQTGTGKTAAFAIPVLQLMNESKQPGRKNIRALVLTPTRELAIQIDESFRNYGRHLDLKSLVIYGGVGQKPQTDALRQGVDILIATPGRLLDLIDQRHISLSHVEYFILDEADRMLDMGFIHDVKKIIARLPQKKQTLFFSATMPMEITRLSASILHQPERVEVTPQATTAETVQQKIYFVDKGNKKQLLIHLLQDPAIVTTLVFARTKHGADRVARDLTRAGIRAEAIHGDKSQNARQRALSNFKAKQTRVLVATDIAARGIDVDELAYVVNYDMPNVPETYVHRIGRTGRAGASGMAISFCDNEEREYLRDITKLIGIRIPSVDEHPFKPGTPLPPKESFDRPHHSQKQGVAAAGKRSDRPPVNNKKKKKRFGGWSNKKKVF
ncbi:MAG TPA: DEAD/DEAH box helicase [Bacteroidia bacterium]|jgi:ATP-dependent RNA helicase RhlE|nr:DEAD/DEAH box helicase [Bacteroidia bacterium]